MIASKEMNELKISNLKVKVLEVDDDYVEYVKDDVIGKVFDANVILLKEGQVVAVGFSLYDENNDKYNDCKWKYQNVMLYKSESDYIIYQEG